MGHLGRCRTAYRYCGRDAQRDSFHSQFFTVVTVTDSASPQHTVRRFAILDVCPALALTSPSTAELFTGISYASTSMLQEGPDLTPGRSRKVLCRTVTTLSRTAA